MEKSKLTNIKLGAPSTIVGGASPNTDLNVQNMSSCIELILLDENSKCTKEGALKIASKLMYLATNENSDQSDIKLNVQSNTLTSLTASEIEALYDTMPHYTDDSNIIGNATAMKAYKDSVDALMERFPLLKIEVALWYVLFKDLEVKKILVNTFGDGIGITTSESDLITSLNNIFLGNTKIKTFNELPKLKNVTKLNLSEFLDCTNLEEIDLSNITSMDGYALANTNIKIAYFPNLILTVRTSLFHLSSLEIFNAPNLSLIANSSLFGSAANTIIAAFTNKNIIITSNHGILSDQSPLAFLLGGNISPQNFILRYPGLVNTNYKYNINYFVPSSVLHLYKAVENGNYNTTKHAIGGTKWLESMRNLADTYANKYAKWSTSDIENANYKYKYIDYLIFGLPLPEGQYLTPQLCIIESETYGPINKLNLNIATIDNQTQLFVDTASPITDAKFELVNGIGYASLTENGLLKIKNNANNSPITIKATCKEDESLSEEVTVNVSEYFNKYMNFEDREVVKVLLDHGIGDGNGILKEDLKISTSIYNWFRYNSKITKFPELNLMTKITRLQEYAFLDCTNLQELGLENIIELTTGCLNNCGLKRVYLPKLEIYGSISALYFPLSNLPMVEEIILPRALQKTSTIVRISNNPKLKKLEIPYIESLSYSDNLLMPNKCFERVKSLESFRTPVNSVMTFASFPSIQTIKNQCFSYDKGNLVILDFGNTINSIESLSAQFNGNLPKLQYLILRNNLPITLGNEHTQSIFSYTKNKIFVKESMYEDWINNSLYSSFVSKTYKIGGPEWIEAMKDLANNYSDLTEEEKSKINYSSPYADYDIMGVSKESIPYVPFEDLEVERVLLANATHADANTITKEELGNITDIRDWFKNNTEIKYIDDIDKSGVVKIKVNAFIGCTGLKRVVLDKVEAMPLNAFENTNVEVIYCKSLKTFNVAYNNSVSSTSSLLKSQKAYFFPNIEKTTDNDWFYDSYERLTLLDFGNKISAIRCNEFLWDAERGGGFEYIILRCENNVPTGNGGRGSKEHCSIFVPSNMIEKYKSDSYWSGVSNNVKFFSIGGTEWQTVMRSLANQYAAEYNPSFDIDRANYADEYIDYDIFGVPRPE